MFNRLTGLMLVCCPVKVVISLFFLCVFSSKLLQCFCHPLLLFYFGAMCHVWLLLHQWFLYFLGHSSLLYWLGSMLVQWPRFSYLKNDILFLVLVVPIILEGTIYDFYIFYTFKSGTSAIIWFIWKKSEALPSLKHLKFIIMPKGQSAVLICSSIPFGLL